MLEIDLSNLIQYQPLSKVASEYSVLTQPEFLVDFLTELNYAQERVWLKSMVLRPGFFTDRLIHSFEQKKKLTPNIDIYYQVDHFTNLSKDKEHSLKLRESMLKRLEQINVRIDYTNPPIFTNRISPVFGRNHKKIIIVDNIAWIGGMNFTDFDFAKQADFLVKITDHKIVEFLAKQFSYDLSTLPKQDMKKQINNETAIIVDEGKRGQSLILETAVNLIDSLENPLKDRIRTTTQLIPDGIYLASLLRAHKRGIPIEIITSNPRFGKGVIAMVNKFNKAFLIFKSNKDFPLYFYPTWVHAKLLHITQNNTQISLSGSHNLSKRGVDAATKEIALLSTNINLTQNIAFYFDSLKKDIRTSNNLDQLIR